MATESKTIEKGIRAITYKNQDGSQVVKFQVRINTKELPNFNALFDDLEVAREIVANSRSAAGRQLIKDLKLGYNEKQDKTKDKKELIKDSFNKISNQVFGYSDEEYDKKISEVVEEYANSETLSEFMKYWFETHIKKNTDNQVDLKNNSTYETSIKVICRTEIVDWHKHNQMIAMLPMNMRKLIHAPKKSIIGEMSIFDLTTGDWFEYIKARLNTVKKSTVSRELSMVSSMYNKLYLLGDRYKEIKNPIDKTLKDKIKSPTTIREVRVSEEEEKKLEKALKDLRNPDMIRIFTLALATGCRRSEVIFWNWSDLNLEKGFYFQRRTKNGDPRKIKLLPVAIEILKQIPKKDSKEKDSDRIFSYSLEGFKTMWQRARIAAGTPHIQFRDLRNEFISRMLELTDNPIAVSSIANIRNQTYFARTHVKAHNDKKFIESDGIKPQHVQQQVGHSSAEMTAHYNRQDFSGSTSKPSNVVPGVEEVQGTSKFRIEALKLRYKFNKNSEEENLELIQLLADKVEEEEIDVDFSVLEMALKSKHGMATQEENKELLDILIKVTKGK
ncbi:site-specific integrase [Aquitalea pelogenes]|uniref:site-specific integrase n=1 Tax=Aquitalea pelogenes TaxID=1293573 RepID=UPI0035AE4F9B